MKKKRELREAMENKIDSGLDRSVNAVIGYVKHIFATEQKKTDFRPESEDAPLHLLSPVLLFAVVSHIFLCCYLALMLAFNGDM